MKEDKLININNLRGVIKDVVQVEIASLKKQIKNLQEENMLIKDRLRILENK